MKKLLIFFGVIYIYFFVYASTVKKECYVTQEDDYLSEKIYVSTDEVITISINLPETVYLDSTVFYEKKLNVNQPEKKGEILTLCKIDSMSFVLPEKIFTNNGGKKYFYKLTNQKIKNDLRQIFEINYFDFYVFDEEYCLRLYFYSEKQDCSEFLKIIDSIKFPDVSYGIVNEPRVRLRSKFNLDSSIIKVFNKNEPVEIIGRTEEKTRIDNKESYWYKIRLDNNQFGWIFGAYIDIND